MSREDLLKSRDELARMVDTLEHQGDFDAHAPSIRTMANTLLTVLDHLLLKSRT